MCRVGRQTLLNPIQSTVAFEAICFRNKTGTGKADDDPKYRLTHFPHHSHNFYEINSSIISEVTVAETRAFV